MGWSSHKHTPELTAEACKVLRGSPVWRCLCDGRPPPPAAAAARRRGVFDVCRVVAIGAALAAALALPGCCQPAASILLDSM
jgi:hypothetical protein